MMIDSEEDKRKFRVLFEKYHSLLYRISFDILKDTFLAEDALQEAYLKIARNIGKISDPESERTKCYLIKIIKSTALDLYRRNAKRREREVLVNGWEDNLPGTELRNDTEGILRELLVTLPVKYRSVYILKYVNRMDNVRIAEELGIKETNVRQRLLRGKKILIKKLEKKEEIL